MRIVQLLPTIAYGDAVGNDTLAIREILRRWDPDTKIYAENIGTSVKQYALGVERMPRLGPQDVVLYHASTGTSLNGRLPRMGGRKVMIYHNVTPPKFFCGYSPQAQALAEDGLAGIRSLAGKVDLCIADSEYNKNELVRMDFTCPVDVCPILIPFADYEKAPNQTLLQRYEGDGRTNLLFVGRVAPNKRQEDLLRMFYVYRKYYDPTARLVLVGAWGGMERYCQRLRDYAGALGIGQDVVFTGHIKFDEILAWYHLADAFVCMSEHEGFCVPLVEAMYFGLPVIARSAAAVPDTLGGSGVLLPSADPAAMAACVDTILRDTALREHIVAGEKRRLADFSYEKVSARLQTILQNFLEGVSA